MKAKVLSPTPPNTDAKVKTQKKKQNSAKKMPTLVGKNTEFTLTIPWKQIKQAYQKTLEKERQHVEITGFRKGKAPTHLVEKSLGKQKLYDRALSHLLPDLYRAEITNKGLKPITYPKFLPTSIQEGKDWMIAVSIAEEPKVELGKYKQIVRAVPSKSMIITSTKSAGKKANSNPNQDRLKKIFQALLEKIPVTIPELLLQEEVNRSVSNLVQQLERMRITIEDYLRSVKKTAEQLKTEYAVTALATLQIECILAKIANEEKFAVSDKNIDDVLASIPDETIRAKNNSPQQRAHIRASLQRQKTLKFLLAL